MQMMNILKPIAFDVIHFMSQLFDYYLYAIYTFFGRNDSVSQLLEKKKILFKCIHFLKFEVFYSVYILNLSVCVCVSFIFCKTG